MGYCFLFFVSMLADYEALLCLEFRLFGFAASGPRIAHLGTFNWAPEISKNPILSFRHNTRACRYYNDSRALLVYGPCGGFQDQD